MTIDEIKVIDRPGCTSLHVCVLYRVTAKDLVDNCLIVSH